MEKILEFLSENFQFLVVKFSIYLNRRVFVMIFMIVNTNSLTTILPRGPQYKEGIKPVLITRNLALNSDAAPNYKYTLTSL